MLAAMVFVTHLSTRVPRLLVRRRGRGRARRRPSVVVALALGVLAVPGGCGSGRSDGATARVVEVVDGDTVDISVAGGRETVRLLGIDTPETVKPGSPVECYGPEASARTKHLLAPGTTVRLTRDVEARDRYGRLLAYVVRASDGLFVNRSLVAGGYAEVLVIAPNDAHRAELQAAESEARGAGRGLWGACTPGS